MLSRFSLDRFGLDRFRCSVGLGLIGLDIE